MLRRMHIVVFALLTVCAANAQIVRVDVRLQQPPPNQLRIADLWKIELNNRSNETVLVSLRGTAEELSIPDGIIAEAFSATLELPPGVKRVTGRDVQPVDVPDYKQRYYDALLTTGNVPSGEYEICVEVIDNETQAILGRDCKFVIVNRISVPILIAPPDESEVPERYPVFTWMPSVPPSRGQDLRYEMRMAEVFGRQTPPDAIARNPAWFVVRDIRRSMLQYPVSTRGMEIGRRYAWMIAAYEIRGTAVVPLGESEVWSFTYKPLGLPADDDNGGNTTIGVVDDGSCPGENWDFETGTLACWETEGEAFVDDPIEEAHTVLGQNGHHLKWWVSSYGAFDADKAQGYLLSQVFQIQNSAVGFLYGGGANNEASVSLLIEKLEDDTFSLPTVSLPGTSSSWFVAHSTSETDGASASERLVPIEWNVLPYLNRSAYIYIRDSSTVAHINVDNFTFYDVEDKDKIKLPVKVMAAGENHSLAATPKETPPKKLSDKLSNNINDVKTGRTPIKGVNVVNNTTPMLKAKMATALKGVKSAPDAPLNLNLKDVEVDPEIKKFQGLSELVLNIKQDNVVWGWGDNIDKAVGPSLPSIVKEPKPVNKIKDVQSLAAGPWHSLAVDNEGAVWAWGQNNHAQLGTDNRAQHATPTKIAGPNNATKVATGAFHSLAATESGHVWFWGWNKLNGLGFALSEHTDNTTGQVDSTVFIYKPFPNFGLTNVIDVAVGEAHSVVLKANGLVTTWGVNDRGQTGHSLAEPRTENAKQLVIGKNSDMLSNPITEIDAGFDHTLALGKDGRVWAWGGNASGQLGDGTTKDRNTPEVVPNLAGIVTIAAGDGFSLAVDSAGVAYAWGNNVLGQLGDGTRVGKWEPVPVSRIDAVQGVEAGGAHAMAVRADGGLWTWGTNDVGQMGEGAVTNLVPIPLGPSLGPLRVERLANKKP